MTDFNVCVVNKLKWPKQDVKVSKQNNGGWDSVRTVSPDGNQNCFTISSNNNSITIKLVPGEGIMNHQDCVIAVCSLDHNCSDPKPTTDRKGWIIEITYSRQGISPDDDPGTTTVEISDNQPGTAQGEETNKE